jgi:transposase
MPRTDAPYAPEYRRRIVELARAGRSIEQLAREFEPTANAIRKWVKQAALDEGLRNDGLSTTEREELTRLRRENRVLREEREILSKAAAWCVSRTRAWARDAIPKMGVGLPEPACRGRLQTARCCCVEKAWW